MAGRHGARSIVINYQPTPLDSQADVVILEDVATVLPQIIGQVGRLVPSFPKRKHGATRIWLPRVLC